MNCITAQSKIMPFINEELDDSEFLLWLDHIENCTDCTDELEVYYTLVVGMQQLDTNQQLSLDFNGDLYDILMTRKEKLLNRRRFRKRIQRGVFIIIFTLLVFIAVKIVDYSNILPFDNTTEQPPNTISGEEEYGQ